MNHLVVQGLCQIAAVLIDPADNFRNIGGEKLSIPGILALWRKSEVKITAAS